MNKKGFLFLPFGAQTRFSSRILFCDRIKRTNNLNKKIPSLINACSGGEAVATGNFLKLQNISNMILPNYMKNVNKENSRSDFSLVKTKLYKVPLYNNKYIKSFLYGKEKFSPDINLKTNSLEKTSLETESFNSSNITKNSNLTPAFFMKKNKKNQTSETMVRPDDLRTSALKEAFNIFTSQETNTGNEKSNIASTKRQRELASVGDNFLSSMETNTSLEKRKIYDTKENSQSEFSNLLNPEIRKYGFNHMVFAQSEMLAQESNFYKETKENSRSDFSKLPLQCSGPKSTNESPRKKTEYKLETFHRSNQDTCLTHKPAVFEGDWVQSGDFLTDCANSVGGELSLGQNIFIAYMPWEGYNFEDAILISERLVSDDLFTSVHIERYEIENIQKNGIAQQERLTNKQISEKMKRKEKGGNGVAKQQLSAPDVKEKKSRISKPQIRTTRYEEITRDIPDVTPEEICHLDSFGIVKMGSIVEEGNILVGKITPINKKEFTPYQKLLYTILDKQIRPYRDSSLRAPKGIKAKVVDIKIFVKPGRRVNNFYSEKLSSLRKKDYSKIKKSKKRNTYSQLLKKTFFSPNFSKFVQKDFNKTNKKRNLLLQGIKPQHSIHYFMEPSTEKLKNRPNKITSRTFVRRDYGNSLKGGNEPKGDHQNKIVILNSINSAKHRKIFKSKSNSISFSKEFSSIRDKFLFSKNPCLIRPLQTIINRKKIKTIKKNKRKNLVSGGEIFLKTDKKTENLRKNFPHNYYSSKSIKDIDTIHIYLAEKRKIQVGDKMSGRHGNKGIVSQILPMQDMPFLPDGTPIDMVLNPLGVPSRMNVGQIYECLLGLAGKYLGEHYKISSFDEIYGPEASRSFVFSKLYEARCKTGFKWLFNPEYPGKIRLYDGRTGDCYHQPVTVGQSYMLRLVHMVDDKIHMRSTGPYSLVTQQPLRGRSKQGGQRLGEMEVWALEGYGAAFTLLEMLTVKSDDLTGRMTLWSNLILNKDLTIGTPEAFKVLICELQALCLDIGLFRYNTTNSTTYSLDKDQTYLSEKSNLIKGPQKSLTEMTSLMSFP